MQGCHRSQAVGFALTIHTGNVGTWQKGQWIRQFDSMFSVMNEEGIILAWQLTRGTGFSRVKSLLMGLQKSLISVG